MSKKRIFDPAKATRLAFEKAAEQRRKDFAAAGLEPTAADLASHADVEVVRVDQKHAKISARRSNVFSLLLARKTITPNQHDAAYRLAQDWAEWKGLDGKGERSEAVDGGTGSAELVSDRMLQGGRRVAWVLGLLNRPNARLLCAFMCATVEEDRAMAWRGIVERETGITRRKDTAEDPQAAAVVEALEALRACYEAPRRQAA